MSTVLAKNRSVSDFNFYKLSKELSDKTRYEIIPAVLSLQEVYAPTTNQLYKKGEPYFDFITKKLADSMYEDAKTLMMQIRDANSFFPNQKGALNQRKIQQELAISAVWKIMDDLVYFYEISKKRYAQVIELIKLADHCVNSIRSWKKGDEDRYKKLISKSKNAN